MYPMSRASDGLVPDVSEAGGNAASDRLGDKGIDRTAYQHDRAVKPALVCTRRMPLVPGIDERRDDRRPYYLAKAAQHVLFCLRKSMREMLAGLALRVRLAAEALEVLQGFGRCIHAAKGNGGDQNKAQDQLRVRRSDQLGNLCAHALTDDDGRLAKFLQDRADLAGISLQRNPAVVCVP